MENSLPTVSARLTRPRFITALTGDALLEPGAVFPRDELRRRILSLCWRDCCLPKCFSRAPAPVLELASDSVDAANKENRVAAWWLLPDGIVEDAEGPYSERLRPYFGGIGRIGQMWPRYEFRIGTLEAGVRGEATVAADILFYPQPLISSRHRTSLAAAYDGTLRVVTREVGPNR